MSSEADLLEEIQRLSGAIDRHKTKPVHAPKFYQSRNGDVSPAIGNKKYINPAVAHMKYVNPAILHQSRSPAALDSSSKHQSNDATRELVIDGITFESSRRKLTRKDFVANKTESSTNAPSTSNITGTHKTRGTFVRKGGNLISSNRIHKPKFSKGKRLGGRNNMVLDNVKGTRTGRIPKRRKLEKQCRFFTMTGVCQRGLTCPYQHDPEKIAICPLFLTHSCPNSADICHLSHDPTPSRVPLCHHFTNLGRCTRDDCPYPHVRVGPRNGVCRDFAVVGYCDKGIDCDKQHVRECPDFAEKGLCPNRTCKLPHVIRANKKRQPGSSSTQTRTLSQPQAGDVPSKKTEEATLKEDDNNTGMHSVLVNTASVAPGAAEEYISLTFEESDEDDEEDQEDDGEDDEEAEEDESEQQVDPKSEDEGIDNELQT